MAGHSQFKNIMHRKNRQDLLRAKKFTKLVKEIESSARLGGDNPTFNPRLRSAISVARSLNLPRERINNALKKALTDKDDSYEEIRYEAYGPYGVALIVETSTDNRNRTASDVRSLIAKSGGSLGETNSVSFMFDRVGEIEYPKNIGEEEEIFLKTIDYGISDCKSLDNKYIMECSYKALHEIKENLVEIIGEALDWRIYWKPQNYVEIDSVEAAEKLNKLINQLEENDDVQDIFTNHLFSEEIRKKLFND